MTDQDDLYDRLVKLGCPRARAIQVIDTALADQATPAYLRTQIREWTAYCLSDHGANIRAVGFFVARKIELDEPCPDFRTIEADLTRDCWQELADRSRAYHRHTAREAKARYRGKFNSPGTYKAIMWGIKPQPSTAKQEAQVDEQILPTVEVADPPRPRVSPYDPTPLLAELDALYTRQQQWMDAQIRTDDLIDQLEATGYAVLPHRCWSWSDSPYAARISQIEREMGV